VAITLTELALADATLSGGARLATASGGLPARITTQADRLIDFRSGVNDAFTFDPDGVHVWATRWSAGNVRKIRISDGAVISTIATTGGMAISRDGATGFFFADYTNSKVRHVSFASGLIDATYTSPLANPASLTVVPGASTKAWVGPFPFGTAQEFTLSTGIATGRTITGVWDLWSTTGKIYVANGTAGTVTRYAESTLASEVTWTFNADRGTWIGHEWPSFRASVSTDYDGNVVSGHWLSGQFDQLAAGGGTGAAAVTKRSVFALPDMGGSSSAPMSTVTVSGWAFKAVWSDDGTQVAFPASSSAINTSTYLRVVNVGTQRARWALPFAVDTTVKAINVPGAHGRTTDGTLDLRRVRFYYSLNGGGTRVEFTPGAIISLAVAASETLTIDADMTLAGSVGLGGAPWIGASELGEGNTIAVAWDDGITSGGARERFAQGFN
jgi:hypothetical protein